jgi:hypothetical protein
VVEVEGGSRAVLWLILVLSLAFTVAYAGGQSAACEVLVFWRHPDGWLVMAQQGEQVKPPLTIRVYVSYPGVLELEVTAGGERIYYTREEVEWKFEKIVDTSKSNVAVTVRARLSTKVGDYETSWTGTLVKQPVARPESLEGWLSPRQWERMVSDLRWGTILYGIIFAAIGVVISIICKYGFKLIHPINMIHMFFIGVLFGCSISWDEDFGVGYAAIALLADLIAYNYLKGPEILGVLHIQEEKRNVNDIDVPIYSVPGLGTCVALQSSYWAVKRTLLGQHVRLDVTGPLASSWTRNGETGLVIANDANLVEVAEKMAEESEASEAVGLGLFRRKPKKQYVMRVDPAAVHVISDLTYMTDVTVYQRLASELDSAYNRIVELETTLEKRALERGMEYAKRHVGELMKHIFGGEKGGREEGEEGEQQEAGSTQP